MNVFRKVSAVRRAAAVAMAAAMALSMAACGNGGASAGSSAAGSSQAAGSSAASEGSSAAGSEAAGEDVSGGDGTLTVAMECAYAPYNWTQGDDSNGAVQIKDSKDYANGYDVMMAKKIADALGLKLEIVKSDWDSLVPAVQSGTVDCVIAGQSITADRLQSVDFSDPYYYATVVALTKKDSKYASAKGVKDLAGATVTSQLNTIWYNNCLPQIPDAEILAAQESAPAMLMALETGRVDAVVTDQPTAMAATIAYPDMVMLDFSKGGDDFQVSDEDVNIGVSMKKGNTALKDKINEVLAAMTPDDYTEMMNEAISIQPLSK